VQPTQPSAIALPIRGHPEAMPTHLENIMSHTLVRVLDRKAATGIGVLERKAANHTPRGFTASLRSMATTGRAVIAELKRASPSKGILRENYQPAEIAQSYANAGAAAISVLTDQDFFQGSLDHLAQVSQTVNIPVLRKDFILDPFQILEARAAGADAILLIVAAHTDTTLAELNAFAQQLNLDVLCEVHDGEELDRAVQLGFEVIGVNCRDLKTLLVDPMRHMDLALSLPADVVRVAESGIRGPEDIQNLLQAGYDAFLVGETLMRHADPGVALAQLTTIPSAPRL
jgi:indole-3-glycerol phosphate synthase